MKKIDPAFQARLRVLSAPGLFTTDSDLVASLINTLAADCRRHNDKWWRNPRTGRKIKRNDAGLMMLMVTELAEACEGVRKNLPDDKLPHRPMVEVEMADCIIRILDYCAEHKLDVGGALVEKAAYNNVREDHTHAARMGKHGKKF